MERPDAGELAGITHFAELSLCLICALCQYAPLSDLHVQDLNMTREVTHTENGPRQQSFTRDEGRSMKTRIEHLNHGSLGFILRPQGSNAALELRNMSREWDSLQRGERTMAYSCLIRFTLATLADVLTVELQKQPHCEVPQPSRQRTLSSRRAIRSFSRRFSSL